MTLSTFDYATVFDSIPLPATARYDSEQAASYTLQRRFYRDNLPGSKGG